MNRLPKQLDKLNASLQELESKTGFANCQKVVDSLIGLLGISSHDSWKLFTDSQGKIRSNATWFMLAEGFADKRAAYKIAEGNDSNLDLKAYWMKNLSKSITSWLVALTPNFEDEPFYGKKNIGVDFIVPESADRIVVVLSNNYVVRTLELHASLSVTQQEIFAKWLVDFKFDNKPQVHRVLWDSFDLEPVNKAFYKGISSFFVELKQHLLKKKVFDDKHAAFFTNRLIGRIVFCWFLDRKGIINPDMKYFDTEKQKGTEYYHTKLEALFFRVFNTPIDERDIVNVEEQRNLFPDANPKTLFTAGIDFRTPFLNGGLFEIKENDRYNDPALVFPADFFDRFYRFLWHYNFTTDESTSSYQQVAIDPEMLGRIFENLLAEQVEETGEQARKAKGAFYTPREIVDYMCRESLREYLKTKISESHDRDQRLSQLLDSKPHEWRDQQRNYRDKLKTYKADIIGALDNLKVIDPACGSGAFPMGMLHLLLQCYERLEPRFDPYKNKLEIIKNNLFGVDIEPMAVEISRLRAWLSIIVDEEVNSAKIQPLPNLDFKFVCANSLIPLEKGQQTLGDDTKLEEQILEIRDKYYNARKLSTKASLREEYDSLISQKKQASLFRKSHRQEQLETYHPFDSEQVTSFFDPVFMYGVKGFNIVIANPPYLKERDSAHIFQAVNDSSFGKLWHQGKMDYWYYFLHKAIDVTADDGTISFITSRYWLNSTGATRLIVRVSKELSFVNVVDIGKLKVFHSVAGYHMISIYSKLRRESFTYIKLENDVKDIARTATSKNVTLETLSNALVFQDGNEIRFSNKDNSIDIPTVPLGSFYDVSQGVVEAPDRISNKQLKQNPNSAVAVGDGVFVISSVELNSMQVTEQEKRILKPYVDPNNVGRYHIRTNSAKFLIYSDKATREMISSNSAYKHIKKHLDKYSDFITSSNGPYGIHRARKAKYFELPKIVFKNMFVVPEFTLDVEKYYFGFSFSSILQQHSDYSSQYLLGILNSEYAREWFNSYGKKRGAGVDIGVGKLRQFPVAQISSQNRHLVEAIEISVEQVLAQKRRDSNTDTTELEATIDSLVQELYGLTQDGVANVAGSEREG